MDWNKINNFTKGEFPEDPEQFADLQLIRNLDKFRDILNCRLFPSPRSGALARFDIEAETSQHYAVDRKSTGVDAFPDCPIWKAWMHAVSCGLWKGIGVYFDTYYKNKPWNMLHLDIRKQQRISLWFRVGKEYYYPLSDKRHMKLFYQLLLTV